VYSPKIREDLIPKIYRLGKIYKKPMTEVVDEILRDYLEEIEGAKQKREKHKLHRSYTHSL